MQTEPPRAAKKYSQTFEFTVNHLHHGLMRWVPEFLKPEAPLATAPMAAAALSIFPGLGSFYLNQKLWWPLCQLGIWLSLFLVYLFTFGTSMGFMVAMALFSFHQYLMYSSYLRGLQLNQIQVPGFWGGVRLSALMAVILGLLYFAVSWPIGDRLFYAERGMANTVQEGDHFYVSPEEDYKPGQLVLFGQNFRLEYGDRPFSLLERILARGGDKIDFRDGKILVNGTPLADGAGPLEGTLTLATSGFLVPPDTYFVLYPVRTNRSLDLNWYFIPKRSIQGRLAFKYFPKMEALP
jgi:signal peptidase I